MTNILTISTLYNKGGAAYIAKVLHEGLIQKNYNSKYLYGYGKLGLKNNSVGENVEQVSYENIFTPHLNYLSHYIFGKDFFSPNLDSLEKEIAWADIIICHTLHSHMISFKDIMESLIKYAPQRKIVFVAHDSWHYTGRCAFRFDCNDWINHCNSCQHKDYYPSTLISFSKKDYQDKINLIKKIDNLIFVTPAQWIKDDLSCVYSNRIEVIRNGIDLTGHKLRLYESTIVSANKDITFCVSCVDLLQKGKVDLVLVEDLLKLGFVVHLIGKNNPFEKYPNAISHGYITNRDKYLEILSQSDCYLFSSSTDIYPTVLVDAICSGCFIFYTESKGSIEIMEAECSWLGKKVFSVKHDIVDYLNSVEFENIFHNLDLRKEKYHEAIAFFSKERMTNNYLEILKLNEI